MQNQHLGQILILLFNFKNCVFVRPKTAFVTNNHSIFLTLLPFSNIMLPKAIDKNVHEKLKV